MQYDGLAVGVALLALLALLVAARILWRSDWLLGWLRGSAGLLLLALAGLIALVANDVRSYQPLPEGKPLVTLSFQALGPQRYQVSLLQGAEERLITLEGDLWQLDARLLHWKGLAGLIGLQPGYRLEQVSGRFLAIEQQDVAQFTRVALSASPYGIDLWRWLRAGQHDQGFRQGVRAVRHPLQRPATGPDRHQVCLGPDQERQHPQHRPAAHSAQARGGPERNGRRRALPGKFRVQLHHRCGAERRRRLLVVSVYPHKKGEPVAPLFLC